MDKTVIVLGGGPAGYVAAIRAAQLGAKVHLVEKQYLGGTCLNVGCIPTKTLLATANIYRKVKREGPEIGLLSGDQLAVDWSVLQQHKQRVVSRLVAGIEGLIKANAVTLHRAAGRLAGPNAVMLDNGEQINGDYLIVAAGSQPAMLKFPGADLPKVIDSTAALSLPRIPRSIAIVGGGVIGVEFAYLFRALGAEVRIIEMLPQILPGVDAEIAAILRGSLEKDGIKIYTAARLEKVEIKEGLLQTVFTDKNGATALEAEYVLVAVGRKPASEDLGLEKLGIAMQKGFVTVDQNYRTAVPSIYAVGDINGQKMLAHAASAQAAAAVEHCLEGKEAGLSPIPACIYAEPEIGCVGLSEEEAKESGIEYRVGRFQLAANGKSIIEGDKNGLVKVIAGRQHGNVLGVQIIGPHATELIAECALAVSMEACVEDVAAAVHPHPSVSESVAEAMLAVDDQAIHWPPRRK